MARRDITGAVDFPYLEGYAAGDAALIEEVLALFEEQVELWIRLLDPKGDASVWRDGAHTIKGASAGIGARDLSMICGEAESAALQSDISKAAHLERVKDALNLVRADIAAYRHDQALKALKT